MLVQSGLYSTCNTKVCYGTGHEIKGTPSVFEEANKQQLAKCLKLLSLKNILVSFMIMKENKLQNNSKKGNGS